MVLLHATLENLIRSGSEELLPGAAADVLNPVVLDSDRSPLASCMKRRHLIVHRADKNPARSRGRRTPRTEHLRKETVEGWVDAVEDVYSRILGAL